MRKLINNQSMKDYDKNKESSYIQYWYVNNLFGWAMRKWAMSKWAKSL